jgi:hypothetical protein
METLERYFSATSKEEGHVDSRHGGAGLDGVDNHRVETQEVQMPILVVPAIIGGTVILLGGGYWILHLAH